MPYIKQEARNDLDRAIIAPTENAGELNYLFTVIAQEYWRTNGANYQAFNDIIGAMVRRNGYELSGDSFSACGGVK